MQIYLFFSGEMMNVCSALSDRMTRPHIYEHMYKLYAIHACALFGGVNCIYVSFAGNPLQHVHSTPFHRISAADPTADNTNGSYSGKVAKSA